MTAHTPYEAQDQITNVYSTALAKVTDELERVKAELADVRELRKLDTNALEASRNFYKQAHKNDVKQLSATVDRISAERDELSAACRRWLNTRTDNDFIAMAAAIRKSERSEQ